MFTNDLYRLALFATGLALFLIAEQLFPHHLPTVPRARRRAANLSLTAINALVTAGVCALCLMATVTRAVPWRLDLFSVCTSAWVRVPLEVVVLDACIYWQHRSFHRVPFLWRFHSVHHTDPDLDVTSASRFHAGEILLSGIFKLVVVLSLGISVTGLLAFELAMVLAAQFQHSNIRLPSRLETVLWYLLVPPSMHRVHHAPDRREHDSNYGTLLTVWDRIFCSLQHPQVHTVLFGLPGYPADKSLGLWSLIRLPFRKRHNVHKP